MLVAICIFGYLWKTQSTYGRTVEGARALGETWLRREALTAQQPSGELMNTRATNGCCNYLERPSMGSQLMVDVPPGNGKCFEDKRTQASVKSGFIIVDIESHPCVKKIVI